MQHSWQFGIISLLVFLLSLNYVSASTELVGLNNYWYNTINEYSNWYSADYNFSGWNYNSTSPDFRWYPEKEIGYCSDSSSGYYSCSASCSVDVSNYAAGGTYGQLQSCDYGYCYYGHGYCYTYDYGGKAYCDSLASPDSCSVSAKVYAYSYENIWTQYYSNLFVIKNFTINGTPAGDTTITFIIDDTAQCYLNGELFFNDNDLACTNDNDVSACTYTYTSSNYTNYLWEGKNIISCKITDSDSLDGRFDMSITVDSIIANTVPQVINLTTNQSQIYRQDSFIIYANYNDTFMAEENMTPEIKYAYNGTWYNCSAIYKNNQYECTIYTSTDSEQIGIWNFSTRVYDGLNWSNTTYLNDSFEVINRQPTTSPKIYLISGAEATNYNVYTDTEKIIGNGNYNDSENDLENLSQYKWYVNGVSIKEGNYTGTEINLTNSSYSTSDIIIFSYNAYDGFNYSGWTNSSSIQVSRSTRINSLNTSPYSLAKETYINITVNVTSILGTISGVNITLYYPNGSIFLLEKNMTNYATNLYYYNAWFNHTGNWIAKIQAKDGIDSDEKNFTIIIKGAPDRNYNYGGNKSIMLYMGKNNFSVSLVNNLDYFELIPYTRTQYNVTPFGQDKNNGIFIINASGGLPIYNITICIDDALNNCTQCYIRNDSDIGNKTNAIKLNTTPQIIINKINGLNTADVWMWCDFVNCSEVRYFDKNINFNATI